MHYYIALILLLLLWLFGVGMWFAWQRFRAWRFYRKALRMVLPENYRKSLEKIPHYRLLPPLLKERIRPKLLFFAFDKEFIGVGISVDDEIRAVISFYACLMVLNIPDECYEELQTILVYPYEVVTKTVRERDGIYREEAFVLQGQSAGDTVVIAWSEAKRQAYHLRHHNVILHELAHVLDFEDGAADGVPPLERSRLDRWTRVLYRRFKALQSRSHRKREWGAYRLLGEYAATDEAEFFAVVTELFFTRPLRLKKHFPDLYEEFKAFYRLDTAELFGSLDSEHGPETFPKR